MRTLVTGKQMKEIDRYTIETVGIPSMVLMERAALALARQVMERTERGCRVWAVCGMGNNGADGVAAARMLFLEGWKARVLLVGEMAQATEEMRHQLQIARRLGVPVQRWQEVGEDSCDVRIDALFGVGLSREIGGEYRQCMKALEEKASPALLRVAADIPSGICAATGAVMGTAWRADVTVTFGWEKMGTALYPGRAYAGEVVVDRVGFPELALRETGVWKESALAYGPEDCLRVPKRPAYSNKGTFGKVLIAAGSAGMCGAAYLSALAACRTGAGLVKVLTPEENRTVLQTLLPEAILRLYSREQLEEGREEFKKIIEAEMRWADVVVLGPGLGTEPYVAYLVEDILTSAFVPVIIDADGLNAIASHPYLTSYYTENIIITPHLGEMARLTGRTIPQIQENLPQAASEYAGRYGITCVLKDAATVAAGKDGRLYINTSGCSAMAKAGSGDVLTGILAGLIAMGMEEEEAAFLGVYLHGLAGERAGSRGVHSLLASELAEAAGEIVSGAASGKEQTIQ